MTPRLTGHFSIFVLVFFVLKFFLGIARQKIANFPRLHCLAIPRKDLSTKKTKPNIEKNPESLGVMLEFQYTERGLLR